MSAQTDIQYAAVIGALAGSARLWLASRPDAEIVLVLRDIEAFYGGTIISALSAVIDAWAGDEATRELLRSMDAATNGMATYLQARRALDLVFELERATVVRIPPKTEEPS